MHYVPLIESKRPLIVDEVVSIVSFDGIPEKTEYQTEVGPFAGQMDRLDPSQKNRTVQILFEVHNVRGDEGFISITIVKQIHLGGGIISTWDTDNPELFKGILIDSFWILVDKRVQPALGGENPIDLGLNGINKNPEKWVDLPYPVYTVRFPVWTAEMEQCAGSGSSLDDLECEFGGEDGKSSAIAGPRDASYSKYVAPIRFSSDKDVRQWYNVPEHVAIEMDLI
jgi:hypothetical protein